MRVTNQMINHGALKNMQRSQSSVSKTTTSLTTGKKIQKASDDPIIAMRALKLRSTVAQLDQYKSKNIKDANSWMDVTENSLNNVVKRLNDVYDYCVKGANDTFDTDDRQSIVDSLQSLKDMIYSEGSATYAGRYIFSGYRTNTDLTFATKESVKDVTYDIQQKISGKNIEFKNTVKNPFNFNNVDAYLGGTATYTAPKDDEAYVMKLAYTGIDQTLPNVTVDNGGTQADMAAMGFNLTMKLPADKDNYYVVGDNEIAFIPETGELVFGKNAQLALKDKEFTIDYKKGDFKVGDLRPDHYFNCIKHEPQKDGTIKDIEFTQEEGGQKIQYEVNYNQYIAVNTLGMDAITHDMGNKIDELSNALMALQDIEDDIYRLNGLLNDPNYNTDENKVKTIKQMLEDADVEKALRRENVTRLFEKGETVFTEFADMVGALQADVGTRMNKLDMIGTRVSEQYDNFKELMSSNEDKETEEAIIDFNEANITYNASLMATSNILKTTLLDYL